MLNRTLVSDDMDQTLSIVGAYMPDSSHYCVENYPSQTDVWTWKVPERYLVHEAYLETEDGQRIVDFKDSPLHIISYSPAVDRLLTWDELVPHLRWSEKRPTAVPWEFKYYQRDWGFCLSKHAFDRLPRRKKYHAVIRSEFEADPERGLRVGVGVVHPDGGPPVTAGEMIVMAHTCHPAQANDDGSGVVSAIDLARRLSENPLPAGSMSVRFWFGPETIGSVAYLAHHEDLIPNLRGGIFLDSTGNRNSLALQRSRQDVHLLDRVARDVLARHFPAFREAEFAQLAANDERVVNGPGVNVPCIALTRFPYEEYHTSDDDLGIVHDDLMAEAAQTAEEIVRIYASNYIPRRTFRGPVFLSGYGLGVDSREQGELNRAVENILMCFEGEHSIFDIAEKVGLDYWTVRAYVEKFRLQGLITPLQIRAQGDMQ